MKYPEIVLSEIEYYVIVSFPAGGGYGTTSRTVYKTPAGAMKKAAALIETGEYSSVVIRKENVYKRTANCEISSSGVFRVIER